MDDMFTLTQFLTMFPDDDSCLEEIKNKRYPNGIYCNTCKKKTKHYKLKKRDAYSCKSCRSQIYPLAGTIFEKTTTPLRLWFYALFLMTQTKAEISVMRLKREIGVTYKTAWRIYKSIRALMAQNNGDLLPPNLEKVSKWIFLNKIELKVVQKQEPS